MQPGTNWQGGYSRWIYNEANQFIMVAKEMAVPGSGQKVPLLDEELNEQAEILFTMLRRSIERTYGNGSKGGGFLVMQSASNTVNNFTIQGGDGTVDGAGFLFAHGWHLINLSNLEYTTQTNVAALTTPTANRTDEVYVDICYAEIGPTQASSLSPTFPLVDPGIGFETSRRIQLTWQVLVAEGATTPANYTDSNGLQHWTFQIATINRLANNENILASMIVDTRNAGQVMSFLFQQSTAIEVWTVTHNLNANVEVRTFLANGVNGGPGTEIEPGLITIVNSNELTIDFDGMPVPGWAYVKVLS